MRDNIFNTELPKNWEITNLGAVCERGGGAIQTGPFGSQLHASDYVPVGIPFVMPTNIGENRIIEDGIVRVREEDAERLSRHRLRVGDIVYSRRGDVTKRALIRERENGWMCGSGCMKIRFGEGVVDPTFASMYLGHPVVKDWIVRHAIGATMPNLNTSVMSAVPFLLPPLDEQKAIAKILSSLDDKIELNRRMNATLEAMSRALFKAWFVDFEPVHANKENRPSTSASAEIAKLFPSDFENGIPKGWQIKMMAECIEVGIGKTPPRKEPQWFSENPTDVRWVSIRDMGATGTYTRETSEYLTDDSVKKFNVRIVPDDTVLLSFKLTVGRVCITDGRCTTNEAIAHFVRRERSKLNAYYLYLYLKAFDYSSLGSTSSIATAVNSKSIRDMPILIPKDPILDEFEKTIQPMFEKIKTNQREIETVGEIRDSLLPRLISGKMKLEAA